MFWCVADFFVRPHGQMRGIALWKSFDWCPVSCSGDPDDCHLAFQVVCSGSTRAALIQSYSFGTLYVEGYRPACQRLDALKDQLVKRFVAEWLPTYYVKTFCVKPFLVKTVRVKTEY